jgi:hypothetical protein
MCDVIKEFTTVAFFVVEFNPERKKSVNDGMYCRNLCPCWLGKGL